MSRAADDSVTLMCTLYYRQYAALLDDEGAFCSLSVRLMYTK